MKTLHAISPTRRLLQTAETGGFAALAGQQVYSSGRVPDSYPAAFFAPFLQDGRWRMTAGVVEGMVVPEQDLPRFSGGDSYYLRVSVKREVVFWYQEPGVGDLPGEDVTYLNGQYTVQNVSLLAARNPPADELTPDGSVITRYRRLFTTDSAGNPPANAFTPYLRIDSTTLSLSS